MRNDQNPPIDTFIVETVTISETTDETASQSSNQSFDRPLKVDPNSYDPFTIARMTDHNVRGHAGSSASQIEQDDRFREFRKK